MCGRGAEAGAGVLGGGGAGGADLWRVQGVGAREWGGSGDSVRSFRKLTKLLHMKYAKNK